MACADGATMEGGVHLATLFFLGGSRICSVSACDFCAGTIDKNVDLFRCCLVMSLKAGKNGFLFLSTHALLNLTESDSNVN